MNKVLPLIFCVVVTLTTAFAQQPTPSPTPPKEDEDVVRISTNLIQVDATVADKDGKIVTDLTADDFEIYENKEKQTVTSFSFVELQPDKTAPAVKPEKPAKNAPPVPPTPNNLKPEQVRRTIALVVDDLGLSFESTYFVRQSLKKFVDEQMQPNDLVAIIRTAGGIGALQQFTTNKQQLYAAIERVKWYPNGRAGVSAFAPIEPTLADIRQNENNSNNNRERDGDERDAQAEINEFRENVFSVGTLGAVNFIVRGMRDLPGRKAVMMFSDGFTLFSNDGQNERVLTSLRRLTDLANRSAVVIYTMDARGLQIPGFLSAADNTSGLSADQIEEKLEDRRDSFLDSQQGLQYLARQTGGFAIINNNSLTNGLERVLNDQKGYYLLGYEPDDATFDPRLRRFNTLTIKVKRPGLRVRYRSGFFGITDEDAKPVPKTPQQQIIAALTSPFATGDINIRLTSLFANDAKTGSFMRSLVYIKGSDLHFTEEKDGWYKATFDLVAVTFGDNGIVVDETSRTENITARDAALQEIREKGFVYFVTVPVKKPGAYQMRVALRDATTSKIGAANQFVEVPNLKRDRLALSGIVLERLEKTPQNAAQTQVQLDERRDSALRRFKLGTSVTFGYAIYNAKLDKATAKPNLTTQFKIFREGKEIFTSQERPLDAAALKDFYGINTGGAFRLGGEMTTGEYVLQIIVKDQLAKQKRQISTQWIDFEITN